MRALAIVSLFTKLTHIQIPEREHMMNLISCVLNLLTRLLDYLEYQTMTMQELIPQVEIQV